MLITMLPIAPKKHAAFATLLSPFVADLASKYSGFPLTVANNLTGLKAARQSDGTDISGWYGEKLRRLGISRFSRWAETEHGYQDFFDRAMSQWAQSGNIYEAEVEVASCGCGVVFLLAEYLVSVRESKLFRSEAGHQVCLLCSSRITVRKSRELFFRSGEKVKGAGLIMPDNFTSEMSEIVEKYIRRSILISRPTEKNGFSFKGTRKFFLDTDFTWSLYLAYLAVLHGDSHIAVSISTRVMESLARCVVVAQSLHPGLTIDAVVYPVLNPVSSRIAHPSGMSIDDFEQVGNVFARRCYLALGLQWGRKDIKADLSELYKAQTCSCADISHETVGTTGLAGFLSLCNREMTISLLAKLRRGILLGEDERHLRSILEV